MEATEKIAEYITELTNENITDHSMNLFESGLLTSLDVLDLISFIEKTFDFQISEEDVSMESFGSINGIVGLVEKMNLV